MESHLACPNQVSKGSAFFRNMTSIPNESHNPKTYRTTSKGFFLESLSPSKVAKALSILSSMSIKLVKCR